MREKISIFWSRRDFRLNDNPALFSAVKFSKKQNCPFLPLFILEEYMINGNAKDNFGYPSRVFLSKALPEFSKKFKKFLLIKSKPVSLFKKISKDFDITIFANEDVHVDFYKQIKKIKTEGIDIRLYEDSLTVSKDTKTGTGNIYSIFTPFKNAVWDSFCQKNILSEVNVSDLKYVKNIDKGFDVIKPNYKDLINLFSKSRVFSIKKDLYDIDKLLDQKPDYTDWYFSEDEVLKKIDYFIKNKMSDYKKSRDYLELNANSKMSLALTWGLISSRYIVKKIKKHFKSYKENEGAMHYISELIWREFYKYLYYHKPELMHVEFQEKFRKNLKWIDNKTAKHRFEKWIKGETGYPIVDAAMMELATTGYMHNRARMIVASVLTKNLGVDWRWGQEYFRAMLIDLDESSNNGGWQWGASVGADPKPIRIFNPYLQAENYDKDNKYQNKFLSKSYIENPPKLLIEHKDARTQALERYGLSGKKDFYPRDY